ncbi:MAG: HupE/UreJ family protein [Phyllobacteriaceae bacterium]|nr:HupE/UreJ family protein [Phyllobacteriaceae bacterium]
MSALLLAASPALAHTGVGHADGFAAGLAHPVFGPDHLLAMLSVGVWSALAASKRVWIAPLAFVSAMLVGAGLAFAGIGLPGVESMIAASVLALGLMIVAGARLPVAAGVALAGIFAMFHGHAHASEATGGVAAYIAGFALATAAIHLAGIGIGLGASRLAVLRYGVGLAVAGSGVLFLAGG